MNKVPVASSKGAMAIVAVFVVLLAVLVFLAI
jgi:hypothetical protein